MRKFVQSTNYSSITILIARQRTVAAQRPGKQGAVVAFPPETPKELLNIGQHKII